MLPDGAQGMMGFAMPREVTDSSTQTSDTWDSTTETLNQNISLNSTNTAAGKKVLDTTTGQCWCYGIIYNKYTSDGYIHKY